MDGFRVLEVASWTFVPAAGAVLADWGADVIKIEHPETGDPQRGLVSSGLLPGGPGAVNYIMEQPNRGKRSVVRSSVGTNSVIMNLPLPRTKRSICMIGVPSGAFSLQGH